MNFDVVRYGPGLPSGMVTNCMRYAGQEFFKENKQFQLFSSITLDHWTNLPNGWTPSHAKFLLTNKFDFSHIENATLNQYLLFLMSLPKSHNSIIETASHILNSRKIDFEVLMAVFCNWGADIDSYPFEELKTKFIMLPEGLSPCILEPINFCKIMEYIGSVVHFYSEAERTTLLDVMFNMLCDFSCLKNLEKTDAVVKTISVILDMITPQCIDTEIPIIMKKMTRFSGERQYHGNFMYIMMRILEYKHVIITMSTYGLRLLSGLLENGDLLQMLSVFRSQTGRMNHAVGHLDYLIKATNDVKLTESIIPEMQIWTQAFVGRSDIMNRSMKLGIEASIEHWKNVHHVYVKPSEQELEECKLN